MGREPLTRNRILGLMAATALLTTGLATAAATTASAERPCGPAVSTNGAGTLGTIFKLKSMHDDDGPGGTLVVGEEFEIATRVPGQVWTVTFADNGSTFFTADDVAPPTGIREVHPNPDHGGSHHMSAHALNHTTGETIDAAVDVPPAPPRCGH